jgi:hypothetical protein
MRATRGYRAGRRSVAGFIWQQTSRNLLPYMTARQNVLLPMRLSSIARGEQRQRAGSCSTLSASRTAPTGLPTVCPAVNSSAPPSPRRLRTGQGAAGRRAHRRAGLRDRPDVFSALQTANTDLGSHGASGHPRPVRVVAGSPDDRDQGRQDEQRDDTARGHGRAGRDHAARTRVRDAGPSGLLELLRDRFGGKTFVTGFSFGATFAAYAAVQRPELVAALVAAGMDIDIPTADQRVGIVREREADGHALRLLHKGQSGSPSNRSNHKVLVRSTATTTASCDACSSAPLKWRALRANME